MILINKSNLQNAISDHYKEVSWAKERLLSFQYIFKVISGSTVTIDQQKLISIPCIKILEDNKASNPIIIKKRAFNIGQYFISNSSICLKLLNDISNNFDDIIMGQPAAIHKISKNIIIPPDLLRTVYHIFNYKKFIKENAYKLSSSLNIQVCPYCNRQYIDTIIKKNKNVTRPTFDHFFTQNSYPILSLSFYNLVPSCYNCNIIKHEQPFTIDENIHPYLNDFEANANFTYTIEQLSESKYSPSNYTIQIEPTSKDGHYDKIFGQNGNIERLHMVSVYNGSAKEILTELIFKCDEVNEDYYQLLKKSFSQIGFDKEEFYKFYFGNFYNSADIGRRPLGKMTRDIVKKLKPDLF